MRTELDSIKFYLWVVDSFVYKEGDVVIRLVEGCANETPEDFNVGDITIKDTYPINIKNDGRIFEIQFSNVLLFQAYDELRHIDDKYEQRDDGIIGRYSKSRLLDFVENSTMINVLETQEKNHYSVITGEFWFHIICSEEPKVIRIK